MSDLNNFVGSGRLTRDAELRHTDKGTAVTDITIASNRVWSKQSEKQEETTFLDVTIWGKQAETLQNFLKKGKHVSVVGRLRQEKWQDKEGNNRSKISVTAEQVNLSPNGSPGSPRRVEEQVDFEESAAF